MSDYHCANCNKDYDFATQGAICPHQLRSEGGKDQLGPWPKRSAEPKTDHPVDANKIATPQTDAAAAETGKRYISGEWIQVVPADFARELERGAAKLSADYANLLKESNAFEIERNQLRDEVARLKASWDEVAKQRNEAEEEQQNLRDRVRELEEERGSAESDHRLDSLYVAGARQAAAMAHQSIAAMDQWIQQGCGGRLPPVEQP